MNFFQKKYTNIKEMWELYKLLKDGLPDEEDYLIYEVTKILENISTQNFKDVLKIMYPKEAKTPTEHALRFVEGLKKYEFFSFVKFVSGFSNGNR